jgi:hypothetical protein
MAFDWPVVEMDWNFCVKLVVAELTTAPPSRLETPVTPRVVLAVTAAAARVPVKVGDAEKTKLVLVVPVAPMAVYPVMLLNDAMLATVAFVPPLATGIAVPE